MLGWSWHATVNTGVAQHAMNILRNLQAGKPAKRRSLRRIPANDAELPSSKKRAAMTRGPTVRSGRRSKTLVWTPRYS